MLQLVLDHQDFNFGQSISNGLRKAAVCRLGVEEEGVPSDLRSAVAVRRLAPQVVDDRLLRLLPVRLVQGKEHALHLLVAHDEVVRTVSVFPLRGIIVGSGFGWKVAVFFGDSSGSTGSTWLGRTGRC